jgi:hypothetical protein
MSRRNTDIHSIVYTADWLIKILFIACEAVKKYNYMIRYPMTNITLIMINSAHFYSVPEEADDTLYQSYRIS